MADVLRFDQSSMGSAQIDADTGWIRDSPILTRCGIFSYTRRDGRVVREYRPADEVFHKDSLASLRGVPMTVDHPGKMVGAKDKVQTIGTALSEGRQDGNDLRGDIIIHTPHAIGTRRDLSLGYKVRLDETPGIFEGQPYDVVQRNIRYNHLAVVNSGRAGNSRLRLDSEGNQDYDETERNDSMSDTVNTASVRIDGIEYKVPPQVKVAFDKSETALTAEKGRADTSDAMKDTAIAAQKKAEGEIEQVRKDAATNVRARLELEAKAKDLKVEFKADAKDRDIKEAVIRKVRNDDKLVLTEKSDGYVDAAYELALEAKPRTDSNAGEQRKQITGNSPSREDSRQDKPKSGGAAAARERMITGRR